MLEGTPSMVRPPCGSRSSYSSRVSLTDSINRRTGLSKCCVGYRAWLRYIGRSSRIPRSTR